MLDVPPPPERKTKDLGFAETLKSVTTTIILVKTVYALPATTAVAFTTTAYLPVGVDTVVVMVRVAPWVPPAAKVMLVALLETVGRATMDALPNVLAETETVPAKPFTLFNVKAD